MRRCSLNKIETLLCMIGVLTSLLVVARCATTGNMLGYAASIITGSVYLGAAAFLERED